MARSKRVARIKRARQSDDPQPSKDSQPDRISSGCASPTGPVASQVNMHDQNPLQCLSAVAPPQPYQIGSVSSDHPPSTASEPGPSELPSGTSNQDVNEVDPLEEIETIDAEGRIEVTSGPMRPADVWDLQEGKRIKLHLNSLHQPVRKASLILGRWLGTVAKRGDFCPINYTTWRKLNKLLARELIQLVRSKFVYPGIERADVIILQMINSRWKHYKCDLKAAHFNPDGEPEQIISNVPNGVDPIQWAELVQFWFSERSKYLSQKGKEARQRQKHSHISGSKSFARMRDEFELAHGRQPGRLEFFQASYQRKDGTYVCPESQEFLDRAKALMAERKQGGSSDCSDGDNGLQNEVYKELYGPEKCGRVRGYGVGVTPAQLFGAFGFNGSLKGMGNLNCGFDAEAEIKKVQGQMENMRKSHEDVCCRYEDRLQRCEELIQQLLHQQGGQKAQSVPMDSAESDDDESDMSGPEDVYSDLGPSKVRRTL